MLEAEIKERGRETVKAEFVGVIRGVLEAEDRTIDDLLRNDMDRLVPLIGEALLEKFPGLLK